MVHNMEEPASPAYQAAPGLPHNNSSGPQQPEQNPYWQGAAAPQQPAYPEPYHAQPYNGNAPQFHHGQHQHQSQPVVYIQNPGGQAVPGMYPTPPGYVHYVHQQHVVMNNPPASSEGFWGPFILGFALSFLFGVSGLCALCCFRTQKGRRGVLAGVGTACTVVGTIFFILGAQWQSAIDKDCERLKEEYEDDPRIVVNCSGTPAMVICAIIGGISYLIGIPCIIASVLMLMSERRQAAVAPPVLQIANQPQQQVQPSQPPQYQQPMQGHQYPQQPQQCYGQPQQNQQQQQQYYQK
ncbi:hypothetical protein DFJ77DRAFT_537660 [Powellomyces hirtus]|nr:hypothetical protein DFJ77DRAFT_537660 [Powellomyces hirtus]